MRSILIVSPHSQTESTELYFPKCRAILVSFSITFFSVRNRNETAGDMEVYLQKVHPHKNNKSWQKKTSKKLKPISVTIAVAQTHGIWNMQNNSLKHIASIVASKDFMDPGVNPSSACLYRCFYSFGLIIIVDWHSLSCLIHCTCSCYKKTHHEYRLSVQTNRITILLLC